MLRVCCCSTAAQAQLEELQLGSANGHLEGLKDEAPLMAVSTSSDPTQSSLPQAVQEIARTLLYSRRVGVSRYGPGSHGIVRGIWLCRK
jgi:hypothetical protein